ncbi:hypothetical protein [Peredibacter starrii]|uniref:Uncharacterized protein n=1 Tax=Peredibacter starrii TaxID=28202 RepID=A0AAX4HSL6_9BACT|nr:hypothetical protein [Peredibacter starrii]WPU66381.1 hypothetical protein SOO65_06450 [Peredibacter starrii]
MKKLICSILLLSVSLYGSAATTPKKVSSAASADIGVATPPEASTSRSGMSNSTGVTTDEMNTSPNPAPATEDELLRDTTLTRDNPSSGPSKAEGKGMEAQQDENALDYSTTPKNQKEIPPATKQNSNKIGN